MTTEVKNYIDTVRRMRLNQKAYFQHRTQYYLSRAKALEVEVDSLTTELQIKIARLEAQQMEIFRFTNDPDKVK